MEQAAQQYQHAEAFNIMPYECKSCGYRTLIWNSRDGVTPFGSGCHQCESIMYHSMKYREMRAQELPPMTPFVWVSHSLESATRAAQEFWDKHGEQMLEEYDHLREMGKEKLMEGKIQDIYRDGTSPRLITREEYLESNGE